MAAASGFEHFLGELECPVCLLIPREGPVGACPVGHIVCKECRVNVESCPSCRRPMPRDGTNTIVNKMIEVILHSCKYSKFGCGIKKRVIELKEHESKCLKRTVKCPHLRCNEEVQIKKYNDHAFSSKCNADINIYISEESNTILRTKNGESIQRKMSRDTFWSMQGLEGFEGSGTFFYLHQYYFGKEQTFAFYVTCTLTSSEAERYLAKITLKNQNDERKCLANIQNVISMDSAPRDKKEVLASKSVMFIPSRLMSGFLEWTETEEGNQSSDIVTTVDIIDE